MVKPVCPIVPLSFAIEPQTDEERAARMSPRVSMMWAQQWGRVRQATTPARTADLEAADAVARSSISDYQKGWNDQAQGRAEAMPLNVPYMLGYRDGRAYK